MSFKDAAIKVLSDVKKPLHYKKITSIALKSGLIEFLGASPEKRMLESLKLEVKKKNTNIMTTKSGFFILKEFYIKNKNIKDVKTKKRMDLLKDKKKITLPEMDDIENISEFSKQIFSKHYFSEVTVPKEAKLYKVKNKSEVAKKVYDYMMKKKKVRYYSKQDFLSIIQDENIFDSSKLSPNEVLSLVIQFNKTNKAKAFYLKDEKMIPYALLESDALAKSSSVIFDAISKRDRLINDEIIQWFNRMNIGQFQKFSKTLLKHLGLHNVKVIKGFSGYYFLTKKLGLSELNFMLLLKKGKEEINKQNIIEARGVLARFGYGNLIIFTSSKFDQSAIEETKLTGTNIVLIDKYFIFDAMKKYNIGIKTDGAIQRIDHDFFLSL